MRIYIEGQATLLGSLKIEGLSEFPFENRDPSKIYTVIEGTQEQLSDAVIQLSSGEDLFL